LLETEELHSAQGDGRVEPQTTLVRPECGVELHPEPAVDLHLALVIHPRHPEDDLPLRFAQTLQDRGLGITRVLDQHTAQGFEHFTGGLVELRFAGIAAGDLVEDLLDLWFQFWHKSFSSASRDQRGAGPARCGTSAVREQRGTTLVRRGGTDEIVMSENFYLTIQYGTLDMCIPSLKRTGSLCATRCWPAITGRPAVIASAWMATSCSPAICPKTSAGLDVPSDSPV